MEGNIEKMALALNKSENEKFLNRSFCSVILESTHITKIQHKDCPWNYQQIKLITDENTEENNYCLYTEIMNTDWGMAEGSESQ
jgi:hypothetical protein